MWAPGTLVVCIDDSPSRLGFGPLPLTRGCVYTVAGSRPTAGVYLVEVEPVGPPCQNGDPRPYWAPRFRPVSEAHRKIVRDLLAPVPPVEEEIARVVREEVGAP